MLDEAIAHYEAGNRAAAKIAAENIAENSPERGDALNLLAVIAQDEGRQRDAEDFARKAVTSGPGNPVYLNTLGNGLLSQGRSDEAVEVLLEAHAAAPEQADILLISPTLNAKPICSTRRSTPITEPSRPGPAISALITISRSFLSPLVMWKVPPPFL
ncbi:MAG: tetratricopeptide repeat protein [Rhodospirillaceae bacterium]